MAIRETRGPLSGREAFEEACARNVPIEVVRPEQAGKAPPARGRLLHIRDGELSIDKLQVPGKAVHFEAGSQIEAFFTYEKTIYTFRTTIRRATEPVRLNKRVQVLGIVVDEPRRIDEGQRRTVYRVSLVGHRPALRVKLWRELEIPTFNEETGQVEGESIEGEEEADQSVLGCPGDPDRPPTREPDFETVMVDASDSGIGVALIGEAQSRFRVFERVWIEMDLPNIDEPMRFVAEVRQTRRVRDDLTRLGLLFVPGPEALTHQRRIKLMGRFLAEAQRRQRAA